MIRIVRNLSGFCGPTTYRRLSSLRRFAIQSATIFRRLDSLRYVVGPQSSLRILAALIVIPIVLPSIWAFDTKPSARNGDVFTLTRNEASHFAKLALKCVTREYPNKLDHTMNDASEVKSPKALHPAFYGCLDWHSSVHGHWMLARLLRLFPDLPEANQIRNALNQNLSATNIKAELEYLSQANRQSFERTYGWAWLLKLAEQLRQWNDSDAKTWSTNLQPLADALVVRYKQFLPRQTYPIRTGVHPNTAFGLAFALDYARAVADRELEALIVERSKTYFLSDTSYPASWEPGGEDFFSPSLIEADLMLRVLDPPTFRSWFHKFLPGIAAGEPKGLLNPATVADRTDPKIVHLDGLNLSRAWCMRHIAMRLPTRDPARGVLSRAAEVHARDALAHVASGDYLGEHWLASFAVYMMSESSIR